MCKPAMTSPRVNRSIVSVGETRPLVGHLRRTQHPAVDVAGSPVASTANRLRQLPGYLKSAGTPIKICSCHDSTFRRKIHLVGSMLPDENALVRGSQGADALSRRVQCRTPLENRMARYLLGVLVVVAGLVALTSAARGATSVNPQPASTGGPRLQETEAVTRSGVSRTLLRPLAALDIRFSLN